MDSSFKMKCANSHNKIVRKIALWTLLKTSLNRTRLWNIFLLLRVQMAGYRGLPWKRETNVGKWIRKCWKLAKTLTGLLLQHVGHIEVLEKVDRVWTIQISFKHGFLDLTGVELMSSGGEHCAHHLQRQHTIFCLRIYRPSYAKSIMSFPVILSCSDIALIRRYLFLIITKDLSSKLLSLSHLVQIQGMVVILVEFRKLFPLFLDVFFGHLREISHHRIIVDLAGIPVQELRVRAWNRKETYNLSICWCSKF